MIELLDILLLLFLVICAVAAISMRDLLSSTIVLGAYSLFMAVVWTRLNAVDVAFTEAAVGAGITTMLMLAALSRTKRFEFKARTQKERRTMDMPDFGDANSPAYTHVAKMYIEKGEADVAVPNLVTAILASYRGYDTLGETTVIFTAGICVILLLRKRRKI